VGHSQNAFVVESFLDELAAVAKLDPYQVRRGLLAGAPRDLAVLDLAAKQAGWGDPVAAGVGRGIACWAAFKTRCALVAEVHVTGKAVRVLRLVAAVDCGMAVNPDLVRAQIESGLVFGLSAALKQRITIDNGGVVEGNFHEYELVRMFEAPRIEVHIVPSKERPTGVGEPGVPLAAPAVANAIFAVTGRRIRSLPIERALAEAT
jgi:CO/xanthine dehydrogenase Mo-binding subunit